MRYRKLGRTGLEVSEVGYGAWGIGGIQWTGGDDEEAIRALHLSIDGALNREWPARDVPLHEVFPADHIIRSTEESLRNLGVETIDLQQLHVWTDHWAQETEWLEALTRLREAGKIRFIGLSLNDYQPSNSLAALRLGVIDAVQVIYNIFEQAPEDALYPLCEELNIGVLARVPFDEGGLTGAIRPETVFPESDFRAFFFQGDRKQKVFDRVERLKLLLNHEAMSLPELALRYVLSHDAVSTVIPGMRSTRHVTSNLSWADGRRLSADLKWRLKQFAWDRTGEW